MDRKLDERVRHLVDEIEHEIGEDDYGLTAPDISGDGHLGVGTVAEPESVEAAVRQILVEIGEDPDREGLRDTPSRVRRMYGELTAGYHVDPERLLNKAIFDVDYSEMVVVKDIPFYSLCEHHLLPFFGQAAVAYIPDGRVIGLSKIPRIVEMYSRRLQVQERMTRQIADFLMERLKPRGVGVVVEASHLCAVMRGVRKPGTIMTTSHVLGLFRSADRTRAEFFSHLERRPPALQMVGNSVEREAPRTVSEVLRRVDEAWLRFNDAAEAFPSERMDDHLEGGWTRKQMLAHVGAWHDLTTDRLTKLATSGETVELTEDEDAINARVARQAVGRTAGEVLKDMELSFNRLRRQIARMTDDQLMTDEGWATRIIAGNTYEHYDEHWPDVYQPPPPDARGGRR